MKYIKYKAFLSITIAFVFAFASCSKSNSDGPGNIGGKAKITMDIDGKAWKSVTSIMITTPPSEDDSGGSYEVGIIGSTADILDLGDDLKYEGLTFTISIPKSKYSNPVGEYEIRAWNDDNNKGRVNSWFLKTIGEDIVAYWPFYDSSDSTPPVIGTMTITAFQIGTQKIPGEGNVEGYTKLAGTFSMNLTEVVTNPTNGYENFGAKKLKITNGKFDLKSGTDIGGLFSQK